MRFSPRALVRLTFCLLAFSSCKRADVPAVAAPGASAATAPKAAPGSGFGTRSGSGGGGRCTGGQGQRALVAA